MARNDSTKKLNRTGTPVLAKTLVAASSASVMVLGCVQTMEWAVMTLRTRMLTAIALASMSSLVAAQVPSSGEGAFFRRISQATHSEGADCQSLRCLYPRDPRW
jgi:hypothetical protein